MTELEKYEAVNKCENIDELEKVLLSFADENGVIHGRTRSFIAEKMIKGARDFFEDKPFGFANSVTRQYGLRQQLFYLKYYK